MADVSVSRHSSDIPVKIEALEFKNAALKRSASQELEIEHAISREIGVLVEQIDLLINYQK